LGGHTETNQTTGEKKAKYHLDEMLLYAIPNESTAPPSPPRGKWKKSNYSTCFAIFCEEDILPFILFYSSRRAPFGSMCTVGSSDFLR
jgi:hypothetical protein